MWDVNKNAEQSEPMRVLPSTQPRPQAQLLQTALTTRGDFRDHKIKHDTHFQQGKRYSWNCDFQSNTNTLNWSEHHQHITGMSKKVRSPTTTDASGGLQWSSSQLGYHLKIVQTSICIMIAECETRASQNNFKVRTVCPSMGRAFKTKSLSLNSSRLSFFFFDRCVNL